MNQVAASQKINEALFGLSYFRNEFRPFSTYERTILRGAVCVKRSAEFDWGGSNDVFGPPSSSFPDSPWPVRSALMGGLVLDALRLLPYMPLGGVLIE